MLILFIVITTLFIVYVWGIRFGTFVTASLATWNVVQYMNYGSENIVIVVFWFIFAIANSIDIKAAQSKDNLAIFHESSPAPNFRAYKKVYKQDQEDELEDIDLEH